MQKACEEPMAGQPLGGGGGTLWHPERRQKQDQGRQAGRFESDPGGRAQNRCP